jgi:hypothetical protein
MSEALGGRFIRNTAICQTARAYASILGYATLVLRFLLLHPLPAGGRDRLSSTPNPRKTASADKPGGFFLASPETNP